MSNAASTYLDQFPSPFRTSQEDERRLAEQAKAFPIQKLPYSGERYSLKFDRRTHVPRRHSIMRDLGDGNLSFSDYQNGFHIKARATAHEMRMLYTPEFSKDLEKLKLVVAQQAYRYVYCSLPGIRQFYGGERVPQGFILNRNALDELVHKATETRRKFGQTSVQVWRHLATCDAHGGYMALRATIAYRAWRQAKDSATIAEELGMSWCSVRQILHRMCVCARRLGLETFPRHHSCFTEVPLYDSNKLDTLPTIRLYKETIYKRKNSPPDDFVDGFSALYLAGQMNAFEVASMDRAYLVEATA